MFALLIHRCFSEMFLCMNILAVTGHALPSLTIDEMVAERFA